MALPMITRQQFFDPRLLFSPDTHTYVYNGVQLRSVTTLVDRLIPPFRKAYTAAKIAKRRGVSVQTVLDEWDVLKEVSKTVGTAVHHYAEGAALIHQGAQWVSPATCDLDISGYTNGIDAFFTDHPNIDNIVPEVRIAYPRCKIAGTIDAIGTMGEHVFLLDWKTSKPFEFISSRHMLKPVADLFDANYTHYALQLSLYARILRNSYAVAPQRLMLVRLDGAGDYELHEVIELTAHVTDLLATITSP